MHKTLEDFLRFLAWSICLRSLSYGSRLGDLDFRVKIESGIAKHVHASALFQVTRKLYRIKFVEITFFGFSY